MRILVTQLYICALVTSSLFGCIGIEAGTHGSIKGYRYPVSKYLLEKEVHRVIATSDRIFLDSVKDEYNDGEYYITMHIVEDAHVYTYSFHFYGGKDYWETSKTSCISIAYAYNEKREGGSVGNNGVRGYDFKLKKEITTPFERAFISKIDSALGMKHKEE